MEMPRVYPGKCCSERRARHVCGDQHPRTHSLSAFDSGIWSIREFKCQGENTAKSSA